MSGTDNYFEQLKLRMDEYVHSIYKVTREFPKEEIFGVVSQIRRATLSIILNYIEGFARKKKAVKRNFWEISYGSLKESKYLLYFSLKEKFLSQKDYNKGIKMTEEIGAMLWSTIESIKE